MKTKLVISTILLLSGVPALALDNTLTKEKIYKSLLKKELTPNEQVIINENSNQALKLFVLQKSCKQIEPVVTFYANGLMLSSGYIHENAQIGFAKALSGGVLDKVNKIAKDTVCDKETKEKMDAIVNDITVGVLLNMYDVFDDRKNLDKEIKGNEDKTTLAFIDKKFFNKNYVMQNAKGKDLTVKETNDLTDKYIYGLAALSNMDRCYKDIKMTDKEYKEIKPKLSQFFLNYLQQPSFSIVTRMNIFSTAMITANTIKKDTCVNVNLPIELMKNYKFIETN